jgi:hypothetical protein
MQHTSLQAFAVRARQPRTALQHCSASDYLIRPTGQSLGWVAARRQHRSLSVTSSAWWCVMRYRGRVVVLCIHYQYVIWVGVGGLERFGVADRRCGWRPEGSGCG